MNEKIVEKKMTAFVEVYEDRRVTLEFLRRCIQLILSGTALNDHHNFNLLINAFREFLPRYLEQVTSALEKVTREEVEAIATLKAIKKLSSEFVTKGIHSSYDEQRINDKIDYYSGKATLSYSSLRNSNYADLLKDKDLLVVLDIISLMQARNLFPNFLYNSSIKLIKRVKAIHEDMNDALNRTQAEEAEDIEEWENLDRLRARFNHFEESVQELNFEVRDSNRDNLNIFNLVKNFKAQMRVKDFLMDMAPRIIETIETVKNVAMYD